MQPSHLKICGLTTEDAVLACIDGAIGFTGFIAYEPSARHISPSHYHSLAALVPDTIRTVLVTVDASDAFLDAYITKHRPDMLQLHGNESTERITTLASRYQLPIIKAVAIADAEDIATAYSYEAYADMLLFDTKTADGRSGGTGQHFDWSLLAKRTPTIPWMLSGGLSINSIKAAYEATHAPYYDLSSALEQSAGIKDPTRIKDLIASIK